MQKSGEVSAFIRPELFSVKLECSIFKTSKLRCQMQREKEQTVIPLGLGY